MITELENKASQCNSVLEHMKKHTYISPLEALNRYGIMRLASRIDDLRRRGNKIKTEMITVHKANGKATRVAMYSIEELAKVPEALGDLLRGQGGLGA